MSFEDWRKQNQSGFGAWQQENTLNRRDIFDEVTATTKRDVFDEVDITPEQARTELRRRDAARAELQRRGALPSFTVEQLQTEKRRRELLHEKERRSAANLPPGFVLESTLPEGFVLEGGSLDAAKERIQQDLDAKYGTPRHPLGGPSPAAVVKTTRTVRVLGPVGGGVSALSSALREPVSTPQPEAKPAFVRDPNQQYFEPAPKPGLFEGFLPGTPELPPWSEATRREKAEKILKPATGVVANVLPRMFSFVTDPLYTLYKRLYPENIPDEVKDLNFKETVAHYAGRDPSGLERITGGLAEFVGPVKLAGPVVGAVTGPLPKAGRAVSLAAKTAKEWGAGEAINQLGKLVAENLDPSKANYEYEGMTAVVKTAATALPIGAIGATELAPIVKTAIESSIFGGITAAEGGDPEAIFTSMAIPFALKGRAGLRWRHEIAADAVDRVRDQIIMRNYGDKAVIRDAILKADEATTDIRTGKLDVAREPDEAVPAPGDKSFLKSEWQIKREFAPGEKVVSVEEQFRTAQVNKHIALTQAFEASKPGSPEWKRLQGEIYDTVKVINSVDGVTDPAEGRPFIAPEYAGAKATPKPRYRVRGVLGRETTPTGAPVTEPGAGSKRALRKTGAVPVIPSELQGPAISTEVKAKRPLRKPMKVAPTVLTPDEFATRDTKGFLTVTPENSDAVTARVKKELDAGNKVYLLADNGAKRVEVTNIDRGMMADAEKQRWGTMGFFNGSLQIEVQKPGTTPVVEQKPPSGATQPTLPIAGETQLSSSVPAKAEAKGKVKTPVIVNNQVTTMEDIVDEAVEAVTKLKSEKRVLQKRVRIGSARGVRNVLHQMSRFFFGDLNTAPYYSAKVLDGGDENGVFSRVFDQNIQQGNAVRADLVTSLNRVSRTAREKAGITPGDLASMSRAVNPSFKTVERVLPKTKIIPVKIGGKTWDFTWGRLINFYGQTSQMIPETNEPIGREYVKQYGIRLENQFTGPMTDVEIDTLRSLVKNNPKAMAELEIEWTAVGPLRAQAVNQISYQAEGRDIAVLPNWYHLEISGTRRVPGKTVEVEPKVSKSPGPQPVESLLEEGVTNFRIDLIENQNIFKARRGGGRGPLVVRDHYEVINAVNHAVAEYYGFALPFRTARTLLNNPDIQRVFDAKGYRETRELLTELFSRIQGSERRAGGEIGPLKKVRANFYRAIISVSPQVILPQPTSVLNYGAYADAKYLPMAAVRMFDPRNAKEMLDTSPIANERYHGGFGTMELGEAMESDAVLQAMTDRNAYIDRPAILMRVTDIVPLNGGWALAKAEFRDAQAGKMDPKSLSGRWWKNRNIVDFEEGDQAWKNVIRERAEYLWQRTQQTWDVTNRSWLSGHPNQALRSLWFFRTYHEKVVGMWNDALLDYKTGRSTKTEFAKRVSYPIASYMAESIVRSIILAAVFGDVKDPDDYGLALITSPLSAFPIFGPVMQAAIVSFAKAAEDKKQRYRNYELINSPMLDMTNEAADASILVSQAAGEWAEGDTEKAKKTMGRAMYRLMKPVGIGMTGLPVHLAEKFYRGRLAPKEEPTGHGPVRRRIRKRTPRRSLRRTTD